MKVSYDLNITYKTAEDTVRVDEYKDVIFDYISDGKYFFIQQKEDDVDNDDNSVTTKLHWYNKDVISEISGSIKRVFETKKEKLEYHKSKLGTPAKGAKLKTK